MAVESRVSKSLKNAKISTLFYFAFLILSFFSRKIFLDSLGPEFLGLTGTLSNILSFLSLAELGVGTATSYNLYKPLQEGNHDKINNLVSVFGYLYKVIGTVIMIGGLLISAVFPFIFGKIELPLIIPFVAFYSFLSSSLIGYFINYRQIVLYADQKGYLVTAYIQGASFIKVLIQMAIAYFWGNLYAWIALEFVFSLVACIILNIKINKEYKWLDVSYQKGKLELPNNKQLIANIKQVFVHRFAGFVLKQSDQLFIFAFVSLKMVAFYGNYTLIVNKLSQAINAALGSFGAGVGNLIAEGNTKNSQKVFWELISIRFTIAGIIVFGVYHLIEPFICLWIGSEYLLDRTILVLLLVVVMIDLLRGPIDQFKEGYGLFQDVWAPATEAAINITVTLSTAPFIGISGLLLGKIVSAFLMVVLWKPYYLFVNGFKDSVWSYWKEYGKYFCSLVISFIICHFISGKILDGAVDSFVKWTIGAIISVGLFAVVYIPLLLIMTKGTRDFASRIKAKIIK